jgi:hypothetical protein
MRKFDSNERHLGYEPNKLPLLYSAILFEILISGLEPPFPLGKGF